MTVRIRDARPGDRREVALLHRALYLDHRNRVVPSPLIELSAYRGFDELLEEDVATLLSDPARIVLLAEREGRVVGYATGHDRTEPRRLLPRRGHVEEWYVVEAERQRGTGRRLLEALVERLRRRGCEVVESRTWASNAGARTAHRRLGFDEDMVVYRRRLD